MRRDIWLVISAENEPRLPLALLVSVVVLFDGVSKVRNQLERAWPPVYPGGAEYDEIDERKIEREE